MCYLRLIKDKSGIICSHGEEACEFISGTVGFLLELKALVHKLFSYCCSICQNRIKLEAKTYRLTRKGNK